MTWEFQYPQSALLQIEACDGRGEEDRKCQLYFPTTQDEDCQCETLFFQGKCPNRSPE